MENDKIKQRSKFTASIRNTFIPKPAITSRIRSHPRHRCSDMIIFQSGVLLNELNI